MLTFEDAFAHPQSIRSLWLIHFAATLDQLTRPTSTSGGNEVSHVLWYGTLHRPYTWDEIRRSWPSSHILKFVACLDENALRTHHLLQGMHGRVQSESWQHRTQWAKAESLRETQQGRFRLHQLQRVGDELAKLYMDGISPEDDQGENESAAVEGLRGDLVILAGTHDSAKALAAKKTRD